MQVPHSYYEDEVRDGFYISGMMKRAWAASIEVLEVIDAICKKHKIQYFADAGTLLGAIRHKGIIPWDDDLDICMLREDYNRFIKVAQKELPERYSLLSMHTEPEYTELFARVVNRKQASFEPEELARYHDFPFVVGIDIFPLDYLAPKEEDEKFRCELANAVYEVAKAAMVDTDKEALEELVKKVEEFCKVKINRKGNIANQILLQVERLISMYPAKTAKEVAFMPVWLKKGSNKFEKECYQQAIEVEFEQIKIPVPAMYDAVLRKKYGDYMKLVHNWEYHEYPFYKGQMQRVSENAGIKYPKYEITPEEVLTPREPVKTEPKKQAGEMFGLLAEAYGEIRRMLGNGESEGVLEILEMCQNGAISIGNVLEETYGEGFATTRILESYCEKIYQVYEGLIQGNVEAVEGGLNAVRASLEHFGESIERYITERKEIVFLPYKVEAWSAMESVWKEAQKEPNCDVYVIPIPYFSKNAFGAIGERHYDMKEYPNHVPVIPYEIYDFAKRKPDVIVFQVPYDEYNYTMTVHPFFYASNLKKYTNKLVYIPPFMTDEIDPRDGRAMLSLDHFVKMPGVVHADVVIVQSEQMRQTYIDALTGFVGEETRGVWEEKILGIGSPLLDVKEDNLADYDVPETWLRLVQKPDGSKKKVVLYNTSISTFSQNENDALKKLRETLEIFKDNREDVTLLWRLDPKTRESFEKTNPKLWACYQKIVEQYCSEVWGIYDDTPSSDMAVTMCDAYYGDASELAQRCRMDGKPVMLQTVK